MLQNFDYLDLAYIGALKEYLSLPGGVRMDFKLQKWREPNTENFFKYSSNIGSVKALEQWIFLEGVMKDPIACENLISFNRFNK